MTVHTVIESLAAYESVRAADPAVVRVWWTTSPGVIEALTEKRERVFSLESDLPQEMTDRLAMAGYTFSDAMRDKINELCPWRSFADIGMALSFDLNQSFFVTLYKGMLLGNLIGNASKSGEYVTCVGDVTRLNQSGLSMALGRFDTLYAVLAWTDGQQHATVTHHSLPTDELEKKHRSVVHRKMERFEKLLSIWNNTPGAFFYKAWRKLIARSWFPFRKIRLWPYSRRHFLIHGSCELLDETIFEILMQGGSVECIDELPKIVQKKEDSSLLPNKTKIEETCKAEALNALSKFGIPHHPYVEASLAILSSRLCTSLGRLHGAMDSLSSSYRNLADEIGRDAYILTSGFYAVEDRMFFDFCQMIGIKVIAFEHGLTLGLSRWTDYADKYYAMRHANIGVYHNTLAAEQMGRIVPSQERVVAGLPRATSGTKFKATKRRIIRKWLDIKQQTHIVIYVAELEKNNYPYGPYVDNDNQYVRKTVEITRKLSKSFPDSLIVLKLYPAQRYVDSHDFSALAKDCRNLRIIRDIDFRFIGQAADLIVTTSAQSTLGWVVGTGVSCLFAEFDWAPTHIGGLRMSCSDIPGLSAMIQVNTAQLIPPLNPSFVSKLFV